MSKTGVADARIEGLCKIVLTQANDTTQVLWTQPSLPGGGLARRISSTIADRSRDTLPRAQIGPETFMPQSFVFRVLALSALGLAPTALAAQVLDVPIYEHASDGEAANCSAGTVMGLKAGGDGFLAVRTGPGASYRKLGELHNGDRVTIFGGQGDWLGVLVPGGRVSPNDACQRVGPRRQLTGSGLGWVHRRWIGDIIP